MTKRTPLFEIHRQMGARIVDFGGWDMPVQYTNIIDEHVNTRTNAGLFDVSHMGELEISGSDSFNFIQWLVTNDISLLEPGMSLYTPMCFENGTFVDDLIIYKIKKDHFLFVVNASNSEKDLDWIKKNKNGFSVNIKDSSIVAAELALQGPKAERILQMITETDLSKIEYFRFAPALLDNIRSLVSRTGYTGEDGFELFVESKDVVSLWNSLLEIGKMEGLKPAGLGARDTLRLEACLRLYGNDIDDTTTPLEAGLRWTVKFDKTDFIGKKALLNQSSNLEKRLVAFEMRDKPIARHGYTIFKEDNNIGYVTSGTFSPSLKKPLGMAYVNAKFANVGEKIEILIRNNRFKAEIMVMPFIRR